jgi:hypothetical protein
LPRPESGSLAGMKPWQSLPGLLKLAVTAEFSAFILIQFTESRSLVRNDGSAFGYFWSGLWYPLAALWLAGWIALLGNWKRSFEIYAAGWIGALGYDLLSAPVIASPWSDFLGSVIGLTGGALLVLAWLRKSGIGDWSPTADALPMLPVAGGDRPE